MNHKYLSPVERLEDRIAPAGVVTATFANGLLTMSGTDGADHEVNVLKIDADTFRVVGSATGINEADNPSKTFHGALKHVRIEGGIGADSFSLVNLSPLKSLRFSGDAGVDSFIAKKFKTMEGGRVDVDLGADAGTVTFAGNKTLIHGYVNIDLGGGGAASFAALTTKIDSDVTVSGGPGSDSLSTTGSVAIFRSNLRFVGAGGSDSFQANGSSLKVKGSVHMDGGEGDNEFLFGAETMQFGTALTPRVVDLMLGTGSGEVTFVGNETTILGNLKLDLGTGGGEAQLDSAVTNISGNVRATGGAGDDTLELHHLTSIGKNLSFTGGVGIDTLRATGDLLSVAGAVEIDGGSDSSAVDLDVVRLALADVRISGGSANDTVRISADGKISGDVIIELGLDGTGTSSTVLQSRAGHAAGLRFGGSLSIDMVGVTTDFLTVANIQVAKSFIAQTGENVSTVDIFNFKGKRDFKLQTGAGADVVTVDNVDADDFFVDTQSGADELRIERNPAHLGMSQVRGTATVLTGIGADQIRIGNSSDPTNLRVAFMSAMTLNAGDGANMRNDVVASNAFASAPTIISTGGTLTQTEAI